MSNITAKTSSNVFYQARCNAATHNEQLSSREGAAAILSIDRGRLYRIESGIANPYPEEIHLMADLYNAPELKNYYCTEMCPIGCGFPKVEVLDLDRITVKTLAALQKMGNVKTDFLRIMADGVVSEEEVPELRQILNVLDEFEAVKQTLDIWVQKNL